MADTFNHPEDLRYSTDHEWARVNGDEATIGITDFAQDELGDIVYIELPYATEQSVKAMSRFGDVESVKATSELLSPVSGQIIKVNNTLISKPELVNEDPYGEGWLVVVKLSDPSEVEKLLTAEAYVQHISKG